MYHCQEQLWEQEWDEQQVVVCRTHLAVQHLASRVQYGVLADHPSNTCNPAVDVSTSFY